MKNRKGSLVAAVAMAGLLTMTVSRKAAALEGEPIVIGVIEDRSGGASFYSSESVKGLQLFIDMVNRGEFLFAQSTVGAEPGILKRPVKAIYEDDENNPNLTAVKARRLVENGAKILFFVSGSGSTLQGRIVCSEQKVLCLAPTNVSSRIVQAPNNDYVFTITPPSEASSAVFAAAWRKLGYNKIAFIEDNTATAKTVADSYRKTFEQAGFMRVSDEQVEPGARDSTAQLLRIRDAKPDLIFDLFQHAPESANMYRSAAKLGLKLPRWGTNTITAQPKLWELAGDAINGLLVVDNLSPDNQNTVQLKAAYQKKYGDTAAFVFLHSMVWDALMLTKKVVETTQSLDGAKLRDAMESISDFPSSYGQQGNALSFAKDRHNGAGNKGTVIVEFANSKPSVVWSVYQPN